MSYRPKRKEKYVRYGDVISDGSFRPPAFAIKCVHCDGHFEMWSTDRTDVIQMALASGWHRTNARNFECPKHIQHKLAHYRAKEGKEE